MSSRSALGLYISSAVIQNGFLAERIIDKQTQACSWSIKNGRTKFSAYICKQVRLDWFSLCHIITDERLISQSQAMRHAEKLRVENRGNGRLKWGNLIPSCWFNWVRLFLDLHGCWPLCCWESALGESQEMWRFSTGVTVQLKREGKIKRW